MTTASEEMRELLTDLKIPAKKAGAIMERFAQLLADQQSVDTVWVRGGRPAVETVEVYGLVIGVDACGNAETVTVAGIGPQMFDAEIIEYSA